ncbi:MAG: two-component system response regulator NarL [Candidatus Sedimenticola sp. (ex Thyasira tokunagai)]
MSEQQVQRMVVIDDHPLLRKGLQQLADLSPDIEIIGETDSGAEGLTLVQELCPDLVLLDLNMPGMNGLETLAALKKMDIETRVVILTVSNAEEDIVSALRNGADGYLLKDMDPEDLLTKFQEVAEGRVVMSPNIAESLARSMQSTGRNEQQQNARELTSREHEILLHIRDGESNKIIGRELNIAEATVKVHVKNLLKKLSLKSRVEAAVWAVNNKGFL